MGGGVRTLNTVHFRADGVAPAQANIRPDNESEILNAAKLTAFTTLLLHRLPLPLPINPPLIQRILNQKLIPQNTQRRRRQMPKRMRVDHPLPRREIKQLQRRRSRRQQHDQRSLVREPWAVRGRHEWRGVSREDRHRWRKGVEDPEDVVRESEGEVELDVVGVVEAGEAREVGYVCEVGEEAED